MNRYLRWAKSERSEADLQRIVDEALVDIPSDVVVPVSTHEPGYTINPAYKHLVAPFPLKVRTLQYLQFLRS